MLLTRGFKERAAHNRLRNLTRTGACAALIQSLSICSFIMPERLKYSSLFRSYRQLKQLYVYIFIYYNLFVSGFWGRVNLSMGE